VEDQPADPGDLTTDAELPATDTVKPRGKQRRRSRRTQDNRYDDALLAQEVTPQATEVTTEVTEQPAEPEPVKPRRRLPWRRSKTAEPEPISTAEEAAEPVEPAPRTPVGKSRRVTQEPVEDVVEVQSEATDDEAPEEDRVLVPHQPAGKRLMIAASAAAVLFVAAAAFAGATLQPYLADRAAVDTKLDVARTAANAISTLWTYTPDNMESLPDRSAGFLGGDFADEYRKYIDAIVAPNKQAQVTNTTQVMGAAVETLTPTEATAIVYTNSVATSPVTKNIPSLRYLSYRLTMQRHDTKWLITRMSTVTSFDLTPQL
jgi:Mce-associated membrane protein